MTEEEMKKKLQVIHQCALMLSQVMEVGEHYTVRMQEEQSVMIPGEPAKHKIFEISMPGTRYQIDMNKRGSFPRG